MCKRTTDDPLLRTFLDQYQLHLLTIPRDGASVGDVYVERGGRVTAPGKLTELLRGSFRLPPIRLEESLADVAGRATRSVDVRVGMGLLEGFLTAMGAVGIVGKLHTAYRARGVSAVAFRFEKVQRDSTDVLALGNRLEGCALRNEHPLLQGGARLYVSTAVVRSTSISVLAEGDDNKAVDVDISAVALAEGSASVTCGTGAKGEIVYSGSRSLAFGVELLEIAFDEERGFELIPPQSPVQVRKHGAERAVGTVGSPDGDVLLQVD